MTKKKSICLVIIISAGIIALLYSDIIFHLNGFLFAVKGDGIKNYYNYAYHIKHDIGFFNFHGMNYPYGETIFMTDTYPLLSNLLKFISQYIVDISPYSVGIMNFMMLISLLVCSVFVFLILSEYGFSWQKATAGAVSITFLSSNVLLWKFGHYALSYSCFFPIAWYLILKFKSSNKKMKYSVFILINTLFWFYTHSYLGLIIMAFTLCVHLFTFIVERTKVDFKSITSIIIQVIIPVALVYIVTIISDSHIGRVEMPFHSDYRASIYSVFFPNYSFLKPLYEVFFDLSAQTDQSWCQIGNYIGFTTNLIIIGSILFVLFKFLIYKKWILPTLLSKNEIVMFLSAIVLLLFSMAIPFKYGLEFLLPSIIKQFVAIGRFAWPFYFVIIIISFIIVRKLFEKKVAAIIIFISTFLLFAEGLSFHLNLRKRINRYPNLFHQDPEKNLIGDELKDFNFSDYQAIVPIPYYHKYYSLNSYEGTPESEKLSMGISYFSGLPLMSAFLSRPARIESKKIMQLFNPDHFEKPVLEDLNEKPILVMYTKQSCTNLETELLGKSQKIFENQAYELYRYLPKDSIYNSNTDELEDFLENKNSFILDENSGYYMKNESSIYCNSFDEFECNKHYRGEGALALESKKLNIVFKSNPNQFDIGVPYNLSFWYYNYLFDQTANFTWIDVKDSTDATLFSRRVAPFNSNLYDGDWAYNDMAFTLNHKSDYIVLYSKGSRYSDSIYIDELLIRPQNQDIYKPVASKKQLDKAIIKNNERIMLAKSQNR